MKLSVPFVLFLGGLVCASLIGVWPSETKYIVCATLIAWDAAYSISAFRNYTDRIPICTRSGVLRFNQSPRSYKQAYCTMHAVGIGVLAMLLSVVVTI